MWASLGDGYRAETQITVFSRDDATIVPAGVLFRADAAWRVYVVEGDRAEPRTLTVLRWAARTAATAAGLKPGETVIVYPGDKVAPGVTVAPKPPTRQSDEIGKPGRQRRQLIVNHVSSSAPGRRQETEF